MDESELTLAFEDATIYITRHAPPMSVEDALTLAALQDRITGEVARPPSTDADDRAAERERALANAAGLSLPDALTRYVEFAERFGFRRGRGW